MNAANKVPRLAGALLAFGSLLLAAGPAGAKADYLAEYRSNSASLQDVNSYLTKLAPAGSQNLVRQSIGEAVELMQSLESGASKAELHEMTPDDNDKYGSLIDEHTNRAEVLAILRKLLAVSDSCEQEALDYLIVIMDFHTYRGQALYEFALARIQQCWSEIVLNVPKQINIGLGKMHEPVFEFVDLLAETIAEPEHSKSIQIRDDGPDKQLTYSELLQKRYSPDMLNKLKQVAFADESTKRLFILALNKMFNKSLGTKQSTTIKRKDQLNKFLLANLVEPCDDLIGRIRHVISGAKLFRKHIGQTLSSVLSRQKTKDSILDYNLSVYRICHLVRQNAQTISTMLTEMR